MEQRTRRLTLSTLVALASCCLLAPAASGKALAPQAAPAGVALPGSPYRYVALSPGFPGKVTVVERIDRNGGKVSRWWYLRGPYVVPAVAYDGSAGGLSADGRTLVLVRFSPSYYLPAPRTTRLAILSTRRVVRLPGRRRPRRFVRFVDIPGDFSFDAISPDGSTIFLNHYLEPGRPGAFLGPYEVRALSVATGRLEKAPVIAPEEPRGQARATWSEGLPIAHTTSPDGRWSYTIYGGNGRAPYVEALDTARRRPPWVVRLPQLRNRRNPFLLRMRVGGAGRTIEVLSRSNVQGGPRQALLDVDTRTLEVRSTPTAGAATSHGGIWLPAAAIASAALVLLAWVGLRNRRSAAEPAGRT